MTIGTGLHIGGIILSWKIHNFFKIIAYQIKSQLGQPLKY